MICYICFPQRYNKTRETALKKKASVEKKLKLERRRLLQRDNEPKHTSAPAEGVTVLTHGPRTTHGLLSWTSVGGPQRSRDGTRSLADLKTSARKSGGKAFKLELEDPSAFTGCETGHRGALLATNCCSGPFLPF